MSVWKNPINMKELAYETTDKQKKATISEWIMSLNFDTFRNTIFNQSAHVFSKDYYLTECKA